MQYETTKQRLSLFRNYEGEEMLQNDSPQTCTVKTPLLLLIVASDLNIIYTRLHLCLALLKPFYAEVCILLISEKSIIESHHNFFIIGITFIVGRLLCKRDFLKKDVF